MAPERTSMMNGSNQLRNASAVFSSSVGQQGPFTSNVPSANPPPLPPRPYNQSYSGYNDYRSMGSNFLGYGYGNNYYRGYGNYGSYGSYGPYSGYNSYGQFGGHSGDMDSRFVQYAEESTRSTMQLVESVLQTFSSVTMMLESTYFAMTTSLRAVLSVAENITRLKSSIGQLLSTLTLLRFVQWFYKKLMHLLGLKQEDPMHEEIWQSSSTVPPVDTGTGTSSWTGLLYFGLFIVIPYLIHRISVSIRNIQSKRIDPKEWSLQQDPVLVATVQYEFAATNKEELNLRPGQKVWVAPHCLQPKSTPGWWLATDGSNVGLIPYNYVQVIGQLRKRTDLNQTETPSSSKETLISTTSNITQNKQEQQPTETSAAAAENESQPEECKEEVL